MIVSLSRPVRGDAQDGSEHDAGILFRRQRAASLAPFPGASRNSTMSRPMTRAGHHAEVRKRRIAAADAGHAEENLAEVIGLGHLLHFRAGIGDGDEAVADFVRADRLLHPLEKILLEDVGFERAAGLAGDDEERLRQVDLFSMALICAGSVESRTCSSGKPAILPKVTAALRGTGSNRPCPAARCR